MRVDPVVVQEVASEVVMQLVLDGAIRMIAGTARSMGVEVID